MHPDIKSFWIKKGHTIHGGEPPMYIWSIHIDLGMNMFRIETVCHGNKYRYNEEWYSEQEMLRIIKNMRAFL